jgi:hypothetical protein
MGWSKPKTNSRYCPFNDLVHLTPVRIPLMNPPPLFRKSQLRVLRSSLTNGTTRKKAMTDLEYGVSLCKTMEKLVAIMNRGSDVIRGGERCEG